MRLNDARVLCARGENAWQHAAHQGLGLTWITENGFGWAPGGAGHRFLLGAVTLLPRAVMPAVRDSVWDSFDALRVENLPGAGWQAQDADPWMMRDPGPAPDQAAISGLTIQKVTSDAGSLLFEHTAFMASAGQPPVTPGELHPSGFWRIPGIHLFIARWSGSPVGTALALQHEKGVVVTAVAVAAAVRGRGIGGALVTKTLSAAPELPTTLAASPQGYPVYQRLGFQEVAIAKRWHQLTPYRSTG